MSRQNISFFTADPIDKGLAMDQKVLDKISDSDMASLSEPEREFVHWYRAARARGLISFHLSGNPLVELDGNPLLDIPQEEVCREIMAVVNAPERPIDLDL